MRGKHSLLWVIVSISAILVITLCSIVGGGYGYKSGTDSVKFKDNVWKSIGPPNTSISGFKVFSTAFSCPPVYVILLITSEEQLLSSGVIQEHSVEEWHWTDISNGMSWRDFPIITLGAGENNTQVLWVSYEGKEYRVDQNGKWSLVEDSIDSPFLNPVGNLVVTDQDYQSQPGWQKPPGEISQIQAVNCHYADSTPTWVFALLKETEGLWYRYLTFDAYDGLGIFFKTIFGCIGGFILAVLVCTITIISLRMYLRRKQFQKGEITS